MVPQEVLDENEHESTPTDLDALIEESAKTMKVTHEEGNKPIFGPPTLLKGEGPGIAELVSEGRR